MEKKKKNILNHSGGYNISNIVGSYLLTDSEKKYCKSYRKNRWRLRKK